MIFVCEDMQHIAILTEEKNRVMGEYFGMWIKKKIRFDLVGKPLWPFYAMPNCIKIYWKNHFKSVITGFTFIVNIILKSTCSTQI